MALNDTVRTEMKGDMSLISRIAMYIPGYRGYRERNLRRDEDRAVRSELARFIDGVKSDLAEAQRELASTNPDLMMEVERLRTKADRYHTDVKKAVNGYSGFHDSVNITAEDLDRVVQWDGRLVEDIEDLRQITRSVLDMVDEGSLSKADIRGTEKLLDRMIEDYAARDSVMKGFVEQGE